MRALTLALAAALCLNAAVPAAAQSTASAPSPLVTGVLPHLVVTPDVIAGLPRRTVMVTLENGQSASYTGIDLDALLVKSGVPHGHALRGKAVADYVVISASDGYRVVFSLAELDPALVDTVVILADQSEGKPLDAHDGPFQNHQPR